MIYIKIKTKSKKWSVGVWPFMLLSQNANQETIDHELIHFRQQLELLIVPFYLLYGVFYLIYGYRGNPFEREAYTYDSEPEQRKIYGWIAFF